jgi:hypothetical protein
MAAVFTVNTGAVASPSNTTKVAVQLATTSTKACKIIGFDITFDGTDSTKTPILVTFARETGASSVSGSAPTPVLAEGDASVTANTTARISDTTDGASPTVICGWYVSPTSGLSYQFPLGREISMKISDFVAMRVTTVTASGTPNYNATVWFEE